MKIEHIFTEMKRTRRALTLFFGLAMMICVLLLLGLQSATKPAHAATPFTVNSTADPGTGGCDPTECTLREAITAANDTAGVVDTIAFNIPSSDTGCDAGVCTIKPSSELPEITDPVTIDGYSQPGPAPTL